MKDAAKKEYKPPRVSATYPKAQLQQAVRPHGNGAVGNYVPGTAPG